MKIKNKLQSAKINQIKKIKSIDQLIKIISCILCIGFRCIGVMIPPLNDTTAYMLTVFLPIKVCLAGWII